MNASFMAIPLIYRGKTGPVFSNLWWSMKNIYLMEAQRRGSSKPAIQGEVNIKTKINNA